MNPINFKQSYVVIELTNNCILRCIHCVQNLEKHKHFKKRGFLKKELILKLLRDLKETNMKFDALVLFWLGEPLLHPKFKEIYEGILILNREKKLFNKIEVHTNGYLLDKETTSLVFRYKDVVQRWHFSLDAVTRETYKKIKNKDCYNTVLKNIKDFVKRKSEEQSKYPQMVFQFIIEKENYKEAKPFSEYWKNYLNSLGMGCDAYGYFVPNLDKDCIFFRRLDCLKQKDQDEMNVLYKKTLEGIETTPHAMIYRLKQKFTSKKSDICSGMWKSPVINWDGKVTVCTNDCELKLKVGDLNKDSLNKIWWDNKTLKIMRESILKKDYTKIKFCEDCQIPKSSNYTGISKKELEEYSKAIK